MTDQVLVQAGWAVWSKRPDTYEDYSVLASSTGPLSQGEFYQLLRYFTPGNPTADADTPGSLPWVMLSRVGVDDKLYLGISVQAPTEDKDGTGRPISRTCYFCIPYETLAHTPVSYQGLYEAVANPDLLPHPGGGLIPLAIPRLDPADLARTVRKLGGTVTATAAMLLDGPVTITGPGFPGLPTRLRFFDAVVALLPYGYRSHLTAATWSDTGASERFRLVFANRARDGATRVPWGAPPRPPASGLARSYLGYLERALGPASGDDGELAWLIDYLAREKEPRKFEEPAHAVASLRKLYLPMDVSERLDAGGAPAEDVRQVFAAGRVRELPAPRRVRLLQRLISFADPQDVGLIGQWADEIAADDQEAVLYSEVVTACRGRLWSAGSADLSRDYVRFMEQRGRADDLLARLVACPEDGTDPAAGLDAVGLLLAESVIGAQVGPVSYPMTQRALAGNAAAGAALLARLAASLQPGTRSLAEAVGWLEPVADRVVRPFVSLLGDAIGGGAPEPVDADALSQLNRDGDNASVRYLLQAASYRQRLHLVLPGFAFWLVSVRLDRGSMTEQTIRYWRDVTMELTPVSMDEAVLLDLVSLITRNAPQMLVSGGYDQPQFSERLATAWRDLATAVDRGGGAGHLVDELLESSLIEFLGQAPWRADQAQTAAVQNLARSLTVTGPRPRLLAVVLDAREALRQMPPGAAPDRIAQACARAYAERLPSVQAAEALFHSGAITSAAQAVEVVDCLHRALVAANAQSSSTAWPADFAELFAKGAFGEKIGADFPVLAARRFGDQILFQIRLLETVTRSTMPGAPPAIDAPLADSLERNRQDLDAVIRDARKRQSRGGILGTIRGKGGAE